MLVSSDLDGLLAEYLLGTLEADEAAEVAKELERSSEARERLESVRARLEAPPPTDGWSGFNAVAAWLEGGRRFEHLVPRLAALFEVSETAGRALVDTLDDDDVWEDGPADGVEVMQVDAGPGRVAVVYRVQPGSSVRLPRGRVLVLEGSYRDGQNVEVWRGQLDERPGERGMVLALEGPPCLCACVLAPGERP
ncbi:MAG: hypothetical protein SFW67_34775 [Myxococcaceae bacterium]|nr:hypothetical protein [Myxococcaceae bacterium]